MGWTGTHRPHGQSLRDFFAAEFRENEILDFATVNRNTCYAAMKNGDEVWGLVILVRFPRNDWENITFKYVSEEMGPNESECPKRILDLLTPTTSQYALEWRERCRNRRKVPQLNVGDVVRFTTPLDFGGWGTEDTFEVVPHGKRAKRFMSVNKGFLAIIPRLAEREFIVEKS